MKISYDELVQLLGGSTPTAIQALYTHETPDEAIEPCDKNEADYISLYLRIDNGEVVPVADIAYGHSVEEQARALKAVLLYVNDVVQSLGALPVEKGGALEAGQ